MRCWVPVTRCRVSIMLTLGVRYMIMKILILSFFTGLLFSLNLYAGSITTRDGAVFDHIKYVRHDDNSLTFQHSAGIATIAFTNLPHGMQQEYGNQPPTNCNSSPAVNWQLVNARLIQVTDEGALAEIIGRKKKVSTRYDSNTGKLVTVTNEITGKWDQTIFLTGLPEKHVDGDKWRGMISYVGIFDYTTVMGASCRVRHYTACYREAARALSRD